MTQTASYESSDYTASGSARQETFADRFSAEFSINDMKQYYDTQRNSRNDATQANSSYAYIIGNMEIVDEGSASTIESNGKLADTYFPSNKGGQLSASDHLSRSGWQDSGDAGRYFSTSGSGRKFSYEDIQMASASTDQTAKGKPGDKPQSAPRDAGTEHVNDSLTRQLVEMGMSYENQMKAKSVMKDLLDGKDVSKTLDQLSREDRQQVMRAVKLWLADTPGTTFSVKENPGKYGDPSTASRYIKFQTKDGTIIAIDETANGGTPKQIQVNGTGISYKLSGAREVYNADGKSKPENGSGFNPVLRLREWAVPFTQEEIERAMERKRQSGEK